MEPFNNFERWTQLKEYIQSHAELYQLLQDFWRVYTVESYVGEEPTDLASKIEYLDRGRTRETFRIGKTTEYELDCGFGKIVLACKVPDIGEHHHFAYSDGFFPTEPQRWSEYTSSPSAESDLIVLPLREVLFFDESAKEGKIVPQVTGIIAGFGILGTITQDVSHGGTRRVEPKDWDNVYVYDESGNKEIMQVDGKKDFPLVCKTDYYFHRLQIDRLL